jgi:hypothetical protein
MAKSEGNGDIWGVEVVCFLRDVIGGLIVNETNSFVGIFKPSIAFE